MTGFAKCGATMSAKKMKATFSNTGVKAGTENLLKVLSTPPANATNEMKKMYGKVMRSKSTVS